jgi:hypothetical protein
MQIGRGRLAPALQIPESCDTIMAPASPRMRDPFALRPVSDRTQRNYEQKWLTIYA